MVMTLFDWLLVGAALSASFNAVHRGLDREMFHTFLLVVGIAAGVLFLKDANEPADGAAVAARFVTIGSYLVMLYVVLWVAIKSLGVLFLRDNHHLSYRSAFWGGVLALLKILVLGLGFILCYAIASPLPSPDRLLVLPKLMSQSALVNLADVEADQLYQALAKKGWVSTSGKLPSAVPAGTTGVSDTTVAPALPSVVDDLPVSGSLPAVQ